MKHLTLLFIAILFCHYSNGQTTISGKITDKNGNSIVGVNIYIEGSYDGASSDSTGYFQFKTETKGLQTLTASFIGYSNLRVNQDVLSMRNLNLILQENIHSFDAVTVTAGTFSTNSNGKMTALKPLDVVTTAGSFGDYLGAFQSLPGTSAVPEDGRLFIRGGGDYESQTFIDGMRVFKPYTASAVNVPSRGRYSPMLFKGMTFSSGGYSAEFGQALSGVLLLNTEDQPIESKTNISIMSIGADLGQTWKKQNNAFTITGSYMNLAPYYTIMKSKYDWKKSPESFAGESSYRHKLKNGMLKIYVAYDFTRFRVLQNDINYTDKVDYKTNDYDFYTNASYKANWSDKWIISSGISYSDNRNEQSVYVKTINTNEQGAHIKFKAKYLSSEKVRFTFGAEQFWEKGQLTLNNGTDTNQYNFEKGLTAAFAETNVFFSKNTVFSFGNRGEYSSNNNTATYSPRLSLAQKLGQKGQFSLAMGKFYQMARNSHNYYGVKLNDEYTNQFIMNYSWQTKRQMLRAELYYKKYQRLIRTSENWFDNSGQGYAKGFDLFWRDNKTFHNLQYWISYSYLDTKRDQESYPYAVRPNYASKHNLSIVGKYWIPSLNSQLGVTLSCASGRPYNNPNQSVFMNGRTKPYYSVNMNWSWVISPQTILYFAASNVLGRSNVYGFRYSETKSVTGIYPRQAITAPFKRFAFIGLFITLTKNRDKNQLNNL